MREASRGPVDDGRARANVVAGDPDRRAGDARAVFDRCVPSRVPRHRARVRRSTDRRATDAVGVSVRLCVHDALAWCTRRRAKEASRWRASRLRARHAGLRRREHRDVQAVPRAAGALRRCGDRGRPGDHSRPFPRGRSPAPDVTDHAGLRSSAGDRAGAWWRAAQRLRLACGLLAAAGPGHRIADLGIEAASGNTACGANRCCHDIYGAMSTYSSPQFRCSARSRR